MEDEGDAQLRGLGLVVERDAGVVDESVEAARLAEEAALLEVLGRPCDLLLVLDVELENVDAALVGVLVGERLEVGRARRVAGGGDDARLGASGEQSASVAQTERAGSTCAA